MRSVVIEDLTVRYGSVTAIDRVSISLTPGEFMVVLGHSGCGKSTLLSAVAGLSEPAGGRILIEDTVVFDAQTGRNVPPNKRDLGMIFQSYALWPQMTVRENVEYPLRRRGIAKAERRRMVDAALERVRCLNLAQRSPGQLSGGQQQRVSLARALVAEPAVMLFDEPLSNLDAGLRQDLREELAALHAELGFTALYVTHDQVEAFGLGTSVLLLEEGRIVQHGPAGEIFRRPANAAVAQFLGANLFDGAWRQTSPGVGRFDTAFGTFSVAATSPDGPATCAVYPTRIALKATTADAARLVLAREIGDTVDYLLITGDGSKCRVRTSAPGFDVSEGDWVEVSIDPANILVFNGEQGAAPTAEMPRAGAGSMMVADHGTD